MYKYAKEDGFIYVTNGVNCVRICYMYNILILLQKPLLADFVVINKIPNLEWNDFYKFHNKIYKTLPIGHLNDGWQLIRNFSLIFENTLINS